MADLLEQGSAWLDQQRHRFLTRTVTYQRGEHAAEVQATVGKTIFRFDDAHGAVKRYVSRDFLIRVEDLVMPPDNEPTLPKRGDRIRETQVGQVYVHEVMGPGRDEPDWRYSDPHRQTLRIHTKQVGQEQDE